MGTEVKENEILDEHIAVSEEIQFFLPEDIVNQITFENVNQIAYLLAVENSAIAKALVDELLYFRDKGVI